MTQPLWTAVDGYFNDSLGANDAALDHALATSRAEGLPAIAVAPNQGKLLNLLARSIGAKRILEVGTLGGYSTIWLARALPEGGRLVSLEIDPHHAEVARKNLAFAGLDGVAEVRTGAGIDLLPKLAAEGGPPLDLSFIDADKPSNADYFAWALKMTRPGGLIIVDNVVRGGAVVDENGDASVQGVRRLAELIAAEPRVDATALQTVGDKGYDGLLVALVKS
ncbi:MAG: O-methyltransferase [Caulobacter sp.]|jgi:predicted O-methyltransferase YrrM|nr:O-methyltransferase [Caulobacter sp.]